MLPLKKTAASPDLQELAIYVHWPFCRHKCPYCDFNSHVRERIAHADWAAAYKRELQHYHGLIGPRQIVSVFFGGGTPSLMLPETVAAVLQEIDHLWGLPQGTEVTLEANPTSVEMQKMQGFKAAGVNRVSLGIQALNNQDLKFLGREHSAAEAIYALETAAKVFTRHSFDLIYARPQQSPKIWREELQQALDLSGGHLSLYQLTIEEGTSFYTRHQRGEFQIPDDETAGEMYEITQDMTAQKNMPAYEISNHARLGDESRHNLVYWRYGDYAGIGPGAHGRLTLQGQKYATRAHRAPELWLERVAQYGHGAHAQELIDAHKRGQEMLLMGLRLSEGLDLSRFQQESGRSFSDFVNQSSLKIMQDEGFIDLMPDRVTATAKGRQRLNAVLGQLLA